MPLVDQNAPFLERQLLQRLLGVGLDLVPLLRGNPTGRNGRRPAFEPSERLGNRFLTVELDQTGRGGNAAVELGAQLRFDLFDCEPRHARVMLEDAALVDGLFVNQSQTVTKLLFEGNRRDQGFVGGLL